MPPQRRRSRVELGEPFRDPFNLFPHLRPPPPSPDDLRAMTYRTALQWCADRQGILHSDRLKLLARARGYDQRWVKKVANRHWERVLADVHKWQQRQLARE